MQKQRGPGPGEGRGQFSGVPDGDGYTSPKSLDGRYNRNQTPGQGSSAQSQPAEGQKSGTEVPGTGSESFDREQRRKSKSPNGGLQVSPKNQVNRRVAGGNITVDRSLSSPPPPPPPPHPGTPGGGGARPPPPPPPPRRTASRMLLCRPAFPEGPSTGRRKEASAFRRTPKPGSLGARNQTKCGKGEDRTAWLHPDRQQVSKDGGNRG
jgi:hypothetical protein